ncbi:uncharacterized protein IWZ02DRAFT_8967 [Phyllosticta citriasiana]|uniref:DUF1690 domain-containing protein n=1 Tax=Phyllosticta citriasiana TaxID=595635 RepID=A0ABR1KJ52_9PEZI
MGAGNSKPEADKAHVFNAAPVHLSSNLTDALQNSPQTDTTRALALERQVQERLSAELEKLRALESQRLSQLQQTLATEAAAASSPTSQNDQQQQHQESLADKIADSLSSAETLAEKQRQRDMSRGLVQKQIDELRAKLESRRRVEAADPGVEKAKAEVVQCLRIHDRRPLDCWREVDAFKREVGRLEKEFVEKTVR